MVPALEKIIQESDSIVFFGGAGVSTESGIPDFRSVVPATDAELPAETSLPKPVVKPMKQSRNKPEFH